MTRTVEALACLLIFCNVVCADCLPGAGPWQNTAMPPQGGQVTVAYDATPNDADMAVPMLGTLVTSAGLFLDNAELLWIRSHDPMDSVQLILGDSIQSVQQYADQWLYFATSVCLEWNDDATGCLASQIGVGMTSEVHYDVVAWTEANDRRTPEREMVVIAGDWAFHSADVNMDNVVDCADLEWFSASPYDWNLDSEVTATDLNGVAAVLAAALADLDGDGLVNVMDLLALLSNWGPCPPVGECAGDLDCDGMIGIQDFLLLLNLTVS